MNCFRMSTFARGKTTWDNRKTMKSCCELLSNEYLCKRKNNLFFIFSFNQLLWIAFKWVPLQEEKQRLQLHLHSLHCCELLSNEYLCKRKNNSPPRYDHWQHVVNCFQMSTFARGKTTDYGLYTMSQVFAKIFRKENKVVFHEKSQS